jgi:hypothetical protein
MVSVMPDRSDKTSKPSEKTQKSETSPELTATFARVRRLMIISALTTAVAIAAVVGVIGYRFYEHGGSAGTIVNGTVFLPKGAHVDSTTIAGDTIVVTLDVAGSTQVRFFDRKTLQPIGQLGFATER